MAFISYAQNFEDVALWRALHDVDRGFYVDVGAWDPDFESVTRAFSERGWRGINVEPVLAQHAALQRRRPRDVNVCAAAGAAPGQAAFFDVAGTGLSTTDPALAARHAAAGFAVTERRTDVVTLAGICRAYAPPVIHFLKLDCEGGEADALAGADFVQFRPWIVLAEATSPLSVIPTHAEWEATLTSAGYRFVWFDGLNRFYVAAEQHDRLAPLLAQPPSVADGFVRAAEIAPGPAPAAPADPLLAATPAQLPPEARIALAQSCRDCDALPKVPDAGQVQTQPDGAQVQIMHNGLKLLADAHPDPWMTRLVTACQGHHAPQEERLFHAVLPQLPPDARMIEWGGAWPYYSAWFLQGAPERRAVVLEPDPARRAAGEQTMRINGLSAVFAAGAADALPQLIAAHAPGHLDLLRCDAQGAELAVLQGASDMFRAGRVGVVFVATHAHPISGDPLTHRRCLALLRDCGAAVEAEYDPYESFSGDGLIVARFGPPPPGWQTVTVSLARTSQAVFRDPSFDLAAAQAAARAADALAEQVVAAVFNALLFRGIDRAGLTHFASALRRDGDAAALLHAVLFSDEFAAKRARFGAEYLREAGPA